MKLEFGERLFWGILLFIGVIFIWLSFFEKFIPLSIGALLGLVGSICFIKFGPGAGSASSEKRNSEV